MATPAELKADLAMYKDAERAIVLGAQSYEIAGRKVTKASLPTIQASIRDLEMRLRMAEGNMHGQAVFGWRPW